MKKNNLLLVLFISILNSFVGFSQADVFGVARSGTASDLNKLIVVTPEVVNAVNGDGNTPLVLASYKGNIEVVEHLIKNGANLNYTSPMGTALMAAVVKNHASIVKLLLDSKANPNLTDGNGTTALHYATMFKLYAIAEMLIQNNADVDLKDIRQKTAFDYAVLVNDDKLIQILKSKKT